MSVPHRLYDLRNLLFHFNVFTQIYVNRQQINCLNYFKNKRHLLTKLLVTLRHQMQPFSTCASLSAWFQPNKINRQCSLNRHRRMDGISNSDSGGCQWYESNPLMAINVKTTAIYSLWYGCLLPSADWQNISFWPKHYYNHISYTDPEQLKNMIVLRILLKRWLILSKHVAMPLPQQQTQSLGYSMYLWIPMALSTCLALNNVSLITWHLPCDFWDQPITVLKHGAWQEMLHSNTQT